MDRYRGDKTIITEPSLSIYRRKLGATNVLAMSFPIMISWQSCGNVLAGGLQRLMIYVWVYRVINCVFQALSLSLNLFHTDDFFLLCRCGEFFVVVEKYDQIDIFRVRYFSANFDINLGSTRYLRVSRTYDYTIRILFMLNDVFSWIRNVFEFKPLKYWNINIWKNYILSILFIKISVEVFTHFCVK